MLLKLSFVVSKNISTLLYNDPAHPVHPYIGGACAALPRGQGGRDGRGQLTITITVTITITIIMITEIVARPNPTGVMNSPHLGSLY